MAQTAIFFFREPNADAVPLLEWLDALPIKVKAKCIERIDRLGKLGHELRRLRRTFYGTACMNCEQAIKEFTTGCSISSQERRSSLSHTG